MIKETTKPNNQIYQHYILKTPKVNKNHEKNPYVKFPRENGKKNSENSFERQSDKRRNCKKKWSSRHSSYSSETKMEMGRPRSKTTRKKMGIRGNNMGPQTGEKKQRTSQTEVERHLQEHRREGMDKDCERQTEM